MYVPYTILKTRELSSENSSNGFVLKIRFFEPAFEPFLLLRFNLPASQSGFYSLQFVDYEGEIFAYMNFEKIQGASGDIEVVAVADLPIQGHDKFELRLIHPKGQIVETGSIELNKDDLWFHRWQCTGSFCLINKLSLFNQSNHRVVFVGGAPKSGTTWVERVMNSHPDAMLTGENNFFHWPELPDFKRLLNSSPPRYFSYGVSKLPPFVSQAFLFYGGRALATLNQLADVANVTVIGDKSPGNSNRIEAISIIFPDSKFVHCLRHPLDIMVSRFFHELNLLLDSPELVDYRLTDLKQNIKQYQKGDSLGSMFRNIELLDAFLAMALEGSQVIERAFNDDKVLLLQYEHLSDDFFGQAKRLFDFIELPSSKDLLEQIRVKNSFKVYSEGRPTGQSDSSSFFRKGVVGDHINYMTPEQIDYAKQRIKLTAPALYDIYFSSRG